MFTKNKIDQAHEEIKNYSLYQHDTEPFELDLNEVNLCLQYLSVQNTVKKFGDTKLINKHEIERFHRKYINSTSVLVAARLLGLVNKSGKTKLSKKRVAPSHLVEA